MSDAISKSDVRHMAMLSRLAVNEEEEELFCRQFAAIIGHMNILNSVDTTSIEPLYSPSQHPGLARLDEAGNIRDRSEILANAPETDGECFIVPRIV